MVVIRFIIAHWPPFLFGAVFLGGIIYRIVTHQPYEGGVPPVGYINDLPSSITGINKHK